MNSSTFIIGGGPSIKNQDLSLIKDKHIIGCNAAIYLGNWINILFFGDQKFYDADINPHKEAVDNFPNKVISCSKFAVNKENIEYWPSDDKNPLGKEGYLPWADHGGNTGCAAIALAYKLGFKQILLLGYDMKPVNGFHNYHDHYIKHPHNNIYKKFEKPIIRLAKELEGKVEVINLTPESELKCFPQDKLEKYI